MEARTEHLRRNSLETEINAMIARLMHVEPGSIDVQQPLVKSGMNSIELIELITRIESGYGIEFPLETTKNISPRVIVEVVNRLIGEVRFCEEGS